MYFAVLLKETNEFIGGIGLADMGESLRFNIEYIIKSDYKSNGYAYEATSALIEAAFSNKLYILEETIRYEVYKKKHPNIKCIYASIDTQNIPSIKLIEKLGFKKDGIIRNEKQLNNEIHDSFIYTLEKKDYKG